jgi:hypothetical protein
MNRDVNEDLIEATIRRIAASKAAAEPEADGPGATAGGPDSAHDGAPGLRLVPSSKDESGDASPDPTAARPQVDESRIEATLRRIEAEQSALAGDAGEPVNAEGAVAGFAEFHWEDALQNLRLELEETRRELRALAVRFDATLPALQDATAAPRWSDRKPDARASTEPVPFNDDNWDDTPQVPRIPMGGPPRPAILRDPSPRAVTAPGLDAPGDGSSAVAGAHPSSSPAAEPKRGFELLPRTYRLTVEDKRRGVDLVPLHRALLGMEGVRDMSLLSYSNGTAIVALETTAELDPNALGKAVSRAMAREASVEVHNEQTMVIKLAED